MNPENTALIPEFDDSKTFEYLVELLVCLLACLFP